jgi:hypothetical protein
MTTGLVRARAEAYKNLKLDADFFNRMLHQEDDTLEEFQDFDVYLMEKRVMPVLLQGLDALSRHIDKVSSSDSTEKKPRFNPLVWLAQYLLRNHPRHVKDHRTPMYDHFTELASIERGRRCLLRRQSQMEEEWQNMLKDKGSEYLSFDDIWPFFERLDKQWFLEGTLLEKLPRGILECSQEYRQLVKTVEATTDQVSFESFWQWFEEHVKQSDLVRASAFIEATKRQHEIEQKAKKEEEDAVRRERAMREALEQRSDLEHQFEMFTSDMYVDSQITRVMNKGAVIEGVEEKEGGVPLQGEHIRLVHLMLSIWGCPVQLSGAEDVWSNASVAAWQQWVQARGLDKLRPVDSLTLRRLMDKDEFEEYLQIAFPVRDFADDDYVKQVVEVKGFVEDEVDIIVEAIDEDTGEAMHLVLPDHQVEDLRKRLEAADGTSAQVLATVDRVSNRITELLPPLEIPHR